MKPKKGGNPGIMSEDEANDIYRNIKILHKASNRFMTVLKESEGPENVGPIISWYFGSAGFARNYIEYARLHGAAMRYLDVAMVRPEVAAEIRKVKMGFNSKDLRSSVEVFEEPIKRIIEYTKILEHVNSEFQGDPDVKEGIRSLNSVIKKMNRAIQDTDEIYLDEVLEYLGDLGVVLEKNPPNGLKLKLQSSKKIGVQLNGESSKVSRECFLFNLCLVIANGSEALTISAKEKFVTILTPTSRNWNLELAYGTGSVLLVLDNEANAIMWNNVLSRMAKLAARKAIPQPAGPPPEAAEEEEVKEVAAKPEESAEAIKFRADAIKALLQSEIKFVEEMNRMEETFLIPLREKEIIDEVEREVLFANFNQVRGIHQTFVNELQTRVNDAEKNNADINLGDCLLLFLPQLSGVCVEHANLFGALEKIVANIKSHSSTMQFFHNEDELELITGYQFNQLNDVKDLIVDIVQNTSEDHYENASLSMSSDMIGAINEQIVERIETSRSAVGVARSRSSSTEPSHASGKAPAAAAPDNSNWLVSFLKNSLPPSQVEIICSSSGIVLKESTELAAAAKNAPAPKLLGVERMAFNKFASGAETYMDNLACETCSDKSSFIRWKTCCTLCKKHVCSSCAGLFSLTSAKERGCQHSNTRKGAKNELMKKGIVV